MFESLDILATEIDDLVSNAKASPDQSLQESVRKFVVDVGKEVDTAFSDVHETLSEIAFLEPSKLSEDKVHELKARLANTYSREKFKNVEKICERLHVLAEHYREHIEPHFSAGDSEGPDSSQLFWLLHKHEGAFIHIIRGAVEEILEILDTYSAGGDIDAARERARDGQKELKEALDHVRAAENRMIAGLPKGAKGLLGPIADDVLRKSPLFSGAFYLGAALLLLTALTIVAGNVNPWMFPVVVAATFAGLTIIGAFQLRNDNRLSEKNFMDLITLALQRVLLPLAGRNRNGTDDA